MATTLRNPGDLASQDGNNADAMPLYVESLGLYRKLGTKGGVGRCLLGLTWETGGTLVGDVVTGIIPVIPAGFGLARRGGKLLSQADDIGGAGSVARQTLIHFTDEAGQRGILESGQLWEPKGPIHARHGSGQYLTDITPKMIASGDLTRLQVARRLFGNPLAAGGIKTPRLSHFIEIVATGLLVENPMAHIFRIPNEGPLDLTGRIVRWGGHHEALLQV
jgi:hypothetical protein